MKKLIALTLVFGSLTQSFANVGSHNNLSSMFDRVQTTHKQASALGGVQDVSYISTVLPPSPMVVQQKPKAEAPKQEEPKSYFSYHKRYFEYGWLWFQTPARFLMSFGPIGAIFGLILGTVMSPLALLGGAATEAGGVSGHVTIWKD